jgi:hypothetical protein
MTSRRLTPVLLGILASYTCGVAAQEASVVEAALTPAAEEPLFTAEELDTLAAPVALFPDSLLTQVFVAATYPLDVMKADQLIDDSPDLTVEARADAVEATTWDPSVQVLASGFPTVIDRMAEDIDWTERLGDAVLVQTDDLLEAVQRMRAQAAATGVLASNDAQTVAVVDDAISIAPADPGVVYVPSYDPALAFASAPAVDTGLSTTDVLTTGAIAFGSAFLVNELFDDDDDWDDYWRGSPRIDWDDGDFRPRPDIDVDGDVTINRGRFTNVDRDRTNIDRHRTAIDGDRIGSLDRDALDDRRDRGWNPPEERRQAARDNIAARDPDRVDGATRKLEARGDRNDARARLETAAAKRPDGQVRRPAPSDVRRDSVLKPQEASADRVRQAKARAEASGRKPAPQVAARAEAVKAKKVSRPAAAKRPAAKHTPAKTTAFKRSGGHGKAASARGRSSKSKRR